MAIASVSDRPVRSLASTPEAQPSPRSVSAPAAPVAPKVTTAPAIEDTYKPTLPRSGNLGREAMTSKLTAGGG